MPYVWRVKLEVEYVEGDEITFFAESIQTVHATPQVLADGISNSLHNALTDAWFDITKQHIRKTNA